MNQVNYEAMSDADLKQYFMKNRQDKAAFQAYLDRLNQRPHNIIVSLSDPDFDEKVQAAIRQKIEKAKIIKSKNTNIDQD